MTDKTVEASNSVSLCSREKYWDELVTPAEQIERLRDEVATLIRRVTRLTIQNETLMRHDHHPVTGELMQAVRDGRDESPYGRMLKSFRVEHGKP